ncbi:MAG: hypothetical protein PHH47_09965 [Gallionella sp.]|nr:hypothetical protein [Gallionella sp.]
MLSTSNVLETDYTAYDAAVTYALGDRVRVVAANVHDVYESLQASNTGYAPATSPTFWKRVGATNRWKMFDYFKSDQTTNADSIIMTLACTGRVDAVFLGKVSAQTVRFRMIDAVEGVVYDQTYSLASSSGVNDWYAYFFEPVVRKTEFSELELPPYYNPTIEITLSDPGQTVMLGQCVVGQKRRIGGTQYGFSIQIQDFSVKQRDAWGVATLTPRDNYSIGRFTVQVDTAMVDEVHNLFSQFAGQPVVYIGSTLHGMAQILGFYNGFNLVVAYKTHAICNLDIESLT